MSNNAIAISLLIGFTILLLLSYYFAVKKRGRRIFIAFIYIAMLIYTISQGLYYAKTMPGTSPDESAHISYIYYLNQSHEIIPTFEDMHLFSSAPMKWSVDNYWYQEDSVNYVCHPPLYYHLMRLAGGFTPTEDPAVATIDKFAMRYFSMGIYIIGLILLLYIGYSRLDKARPWLHLLYATVVTSIPMMAYELCGVTNDALALVTAALCALGLIRFCEEKRGYLTYILIAVGITGSYLTKMTAALLCIITSLLVLVITMIMEKSLKNSLKKEFFVTIPIYLLALIYFIHIYRAYGSWQPSLEVISTPEYFHNTIYYIDPKERVSFTTGEYFTYYFSRFFLSWSGIEAGQRFMKFSPFSKATLPAELLWFLPALVILPWVKNVSKKLTLPVFAGWISCIISFILQAKSAYGTYLTRGYMGGFQSRYYLPFIFVFAFGLVFFLQSLVVANGYDPETETIVITDLSTYSRKFFRNQLIYLVALAYAFLLFYGNFPFFLMHFAQ
ncbi:MAG: hypothetical protein K5773_01105 [Pseudobutyrivibrio sp.]|nr:hypothetical protein [Pseudobutyrivibrio sp.]